MSDNNVDINPRLNIIDIPSSTSYWFVRANSQAQYYTDFQLNNYVATDSNGLSVKPLLEIPSTIRASEDALIESYKSVFQTHDLAKFDESVKQSKLTPAELKKARTKALTRSSNRAKKAFNFIENMNIGDFVIVPYKSSGYFLIGVVVSDVFDHPIEHIEMLDEEGENEYDVSPFTLKRSVLWIKELPRDKFPDKLSWIKTAHQSIFDITGYANDLNPYISPIYRYKKKVYCRIGVNTTDSISASDWLDYQIALRDIVQDNLNNVYQKQKVQSPGDIILYVEQNFWWLLPLILGCLFGDVSFTHGDFKVNFQGVFRYFSKGE